jgi:hypothetical protein
MPVSPADFYASQPLRIGLADCTCEGLHGRSTNPSSP